MKIRITKCGHCGKLIDIKEKHNLDDCIKYLKKKHLVKNFRRKKMKLKNCNDGTIIKINPKRETKRGIYTDDDRFFRWDLWQPEDS